jgi:hypothetical protein
VQDLAHLDAADPAAAAQLHACASQLEQAHRDLQELEDLVTRLEHDSPG